MDRSSKIVEAYQKYAAGMQPRIQQMVASTPQDQVQAKIQARSHHSRLGTLSFIVE